MSSLCRFYKRDKSQVTAKEKAAARTLRDEMLATSRANASKQLAGSLASVRAEQEEADLDGTPLGNPAQMIPEAE